MVPHAVIYTRYLWELYLHFCMLLAGLFQQEAWQQLNQGNYAVIITHK